MTVSFVGPGSEWPRRRALRSRRDLVSRRLGKRRPHACPHRKKTSRKKTSERLGLFFRLGKRRPKKDISTSSRKKTSERLPASSGFRRVSRFRQTVGIGIGIIVIIVIIINIIIIISSSSSSSSCQKSKAIINTTTIATMELVAIVMTTSAQTSSGSFVRAPFSLGARLRNAHLYMPSVPHMA